MGNISSCCLPCNKKNDYDNINERTRILNDPTDGRYGGEDGCYTGDNVAINSKESANYGTINNGAGSNKNINEQSNAWHRILNKMLLNVIDVSSVDVPSVEQNEYTERTRLYQNRINQLRQPLLLKYRLPGKLYGQSGGSSGVGSGYKRLIEGDQRDSYPFKGVPEDDILLINEISRKTNDAVKRGFQVNVEEELVVQFNP